MEQVASQANFFDFIKVEPVDKPLVRNRENYLTQGAAATKELLALVKSNWNNPKLRLFAIDCAERVLPIRRIRGQHVDLACQRLHLARMAANGLASEAEMLALSLVMDFPEPWDSAASAAAHSIEQTINVRLDMAAWYAAKHAAEAVGRLARSHSFWHQSGFVGGRCEFADRFAQAHERKAQLGILKGHLAG